MDSNCRRYQQDKIHRTKEQISQVLNNDIPKKMIPLTLTDFFDFVSSKVGVSRSALMRNRSHYREIILSKYYEVKHAHGLIEGEKLIIANLSRNLEIKTIELSNAKAQVGKLTKVLKNMGDPQIPSTSPFSPAPKNYLKEYEETCRALACLLEHTSPLGISIDPDFTVIDSGSPDGSIMIVVDCTDMKAYARWKNGSK